MSCSMTSTLHKLFLLGTLVLAVSGIAACAAEIARRPAELAPVAGPPGSKIEVLEDAQISVGPGYERVIGRGSMWTRVGRLAEGEVFKPIDRVFTVEGKHIHEAYLVLDRERVVGFYLPVERAFSPMPDGDVKRLLIRRSEP